jgi:hypothetical protein
MMARNIDNSGSWVAILVGLPIGLLFSIVVLVFSLFPPIDFVLIFIGGGVFWKPFVCFVAIPLSFAYLLWQAGKRIKPNFDKGYSLLKVSFVFTFYMIFFTPTLSAKIFHSIPIVGIAVALVMSSFILATAITTFTLGVFIAAITKYRFTISDSEMTI